MAEQLQYRPSDFEMSDEELRVQRKTEKAAQFDVMREQMQQASDEFDRLVQEAMENRASEIRLNNDQHTPTFQNRFRSLVEENHIPGLLIICHDPRTDNHFQFVYQQEPENPNFKFS